jgi:hypothetical protein
MNPIGNEHSSLQYDLIESFKVFGTEITTGRNTSKHNAICLKNKLKRKKRNKRR